MTKLKGSDRTSNDLPGPSGKRSGRVAFDERGNSVWEWQLETGVYSRDVSTQRLKKLELDELSIAETAANKRPTGLAGGESKAPSTGFNPYDNTTRAAGGASPYDTARALGEKVRDDAQPQKRRTLDDMRKLSEAIKKAKQSKG
ncbi:MAG: hypothetical protein GX535_01530 [Xanthomonadaceae bacterium]|nr:hypothetical protein [Xanthomonadaceae bacterium]